MTQSRSKPEVQLWTDGSTYPTNPGHGGWAAILIMGDRHRVLSGHVKKATNNNMETAGVLYGLLALNKPCVVRLFTDSMYVIKGLKALRYDRLLETNTDLWVQLQPLAKKHTIIWEHVMGHTGVMMNEWANDVAGEAARSRAGVDEYVETVPEAIQKRTERAEKRRAKKAQGISK